MFWEKSREGRVFDGFFGLIQKIPPKIIRIKIIKDTYGRWCGLIKGTRSSGLGGKDC